MNVFTRVIQVALNEANKPLTYVKGEEFEKLVRERLFPDSHYILLGKTHARNTNNKDFVATSKEPDFRFKSRQSGNEFYVEAKYRSGFHNGMLEWCRPYQLKRYQQIDNEIPIYLAIGVGGHPGSPEQLFLIPLQHIRYIRLYPTFLKRYQISLASYVSEKKMASLA